MSRAQSRAFLSCLVVLTAVLCSAARVAHCQSPAARDASEELIPPGVEQIIPRGGIPAVFEPEFVGADEADISDDAWVLGVFLNGEARAYSLNLLNHHEVVNDVVGGRPIAAVW